MQTRSFVLPALLLAALAIPSTALAIDADGDGYDNTVDCNDADATIYPGAVELCDGMDNDCDGMVDEGCGGPTDSDGDGYDSSTDCDDGDASVHPGADEYCDGVDNDCDGVVDEDDAVDAITWYADADMDGYGDPDTSVTTCLAASGWVSDSTDCDDADATINPAATEVADGVDNDCDGDIDEGVATDADGDGFDSSTDCDDDDAAVNPDATEICDDGIDNDCDGDVDTDDDACAGDTGDPPATDADGDGFEESTDCDDDDASINPDAAEVCDGVDNDCDGEVDEGCVTDTGEPKDDDEEPGTGGCTGAGGGLTYALLLPFLLLGGRRRLW